MLRRGLQARFDQACRAARQVALLVQPVAFRFAAQPGHLSLGQLPGRNNGPALRFGQIMAAIDIDWEDRIDRKVRRFMGLTYSVCFFMVIGNSLP